MSEVMRFDLALLLKHPLLTRDLIAPTIYRLAETRKQWSEGERGIEVTFRNSLKGASRDVPVRLEWQLSELALEQGYHQVREDLRKLADTKNEDAITELAALGTAFALVTVLFPSDNITKVVQKGGRGDFYLNGRRDEMLEVAGTVKGNLNTLFERKKAQVLLNRSLRRALVNVSRFQDPKSRLERVR